MAALGDVGTLSLESRVKLMSHVLVRARRQLLVELATHPFRRIADSNCYHQFKISVLSCD